MNARRLELPPSRSTRGAEARARGARRRRMRRVVGARAAAAPRTSSVESRLAARAAGGAAGLCARFGRRSSSTIHAALRDSSTHRVRRVAPRSPKMCLVDATASRSTTPARAADISRGAGRARARAARYLSSNRCRPMPTLRPLPLCCEHPACRLGPTHVQGERSASEHRCRDARRPRRRCAPAPELRAAARRALRGDVAPRARVPSTSARRAGERQGEGGEGARSHPTSAQRRHRLSSDVQYAEQEIGPRQRRA